MSLDGNYDDDNIFAKILRGDIPNATVYEDDDVLSFMDAFPQTPGHILVIPKAPSRNLLDTDPSVLQKVIVKTQEIAAAAKKAFNPDGIVITQFNGAPAGQTVFHLHFHILPRYAEQALGAHAGGQMADFSDLQEKAAQVKAALTP